MSKKIFSKKSGFHECLKNTSYQPYRELETFNGLILKKATNQWKTREIKDSEETAYIGALCYAQIQKELKI